MYVLIYYTSTSIVCSKERVCDEQSYCVEIEHVLHKEHKENLTVSTKRFYFPFLVNLCIPAISLTEYWNDSQQICILILLLGRHFRSILQTATVDSLPFVIVYTKFSCRFFLFQFVTYSHGICTNAIGLTQITELALCDFYEYRFLPEKASNSE